MYFREKHKQSGVMLLEALIGILIFSVGALALVAMYANSFSIASDAQYRMEANNYANRILNEMWVLADRTAPTDAAFSASLASFHYNGDPGGSCDVGFGGGGGNATVDDWLDAVTAPGTGLPQADAGRVQILFSAAADNQVTVTVCWQGPSDNAYRQHVLVGNIR